MSKVIAGIFFVLLLQGSAVQAAVAEKRVALIVGNSAYELAPLTNPKNDADDLTASLKRLNFSVTELKDAGVREFDKAVDDFIVQANGADVALFFFAGHGVQVDKRGYLVPVDFKAETESSALRELEPIQEVVSRIENAAKLSIIMLDACRNNPFQERIRRAGISKDRDLAPVRGLPPLSVTGSNTLVVYATVPGETASDGGGRNSPFTGSLLKHVETPGLEIELMFKRVTADVLNSTHGKQQPERLSRLQNEVVLVPAAQIASSPIQGQEAIPVGIPMAPPPSRSEACSDGLLVAVAEGSTRPCIKPGSGESFTDCAGCPEMVIAPAGASTVGSPNDEPDRHAGDWPQHTITIAKPFAAGRFPITRDEFEAFVKASGYTLPNNCWVNANGVWKPDRSKSFRDPGFEQKGTHPVVCVSWLDAKAYIEWLSKKTGKRYRLLSETEREYVARAGTLTPFWWGDTITPEQANYDASQMYAGGGRIGAVPNGTVEARSFKPNPWGLYQMHGNVWDWVEDCDGTTAPNDGSNAIVEGCMYRILRGGSWFSYSASLRAAQRVKDRQDWPKYTYGFRVARELN